MKDFKHWIAVTVVAVIVGFILYEYASKDQIHQYVKIYNTGDDIHDYRYKSVTDIIQMRGNPEFILITEYKSVARIVIGDYKAIDSMIYKEYLLTKSFVTNVNKKENLLNNLKQKIK